MKKLRLQAAQTLSENYPNEFPSIVEALMEDYSTASKKKPRYFPNSWIHRMKLHCLQPIVFSNSDLSERTIEILIEELLNINNQLNVTYLIEIILARHHPNIIEILKDDETVSRLKSPALKSIFAIAVMQLKMEDSCKLLDENFFGIAELKLETTHDIILPFAMGQNYGVRSYAQAAILMLFKHVKSQFGTRKSRVMARIAKSCEVISQSMKFKNAARFLEVLKKDFRFTLKFDKILMVDTFYHFIPHATNMPFEEVIKSSKKIDDLQFTIAEMENEPDGLVVSSELPLPTSQEPQSNPTNFQQKYVPYKSQIPGEKLLSTLPAIFHYNHENQLGLVSLRKGSLRDRRQRYLAVMVTKM